MKIYEVLEYQSLYAKLKDQPISIKVAYKLNKLNNKIQEEIKFYEESLKKILDQYAEKDENGNYIENEAKTGVLIQKDFREICYKKVNELHNLDISNIDITFTLDELENLQITPSDLNCLLDLITE